MKPDVVHEIDVTDLALGLWVALAVAYCIWEALRAPPERDDSETNSERTPNETRTSAGGDVVRLTEPALQHLEVGETVAVDRWHGGTVTVGAVDAVVPVDVEEEGE